MWISGDSMEPKYQMALWLLFVERFDYDGAVLCTVVYVANCKQFIEEDLA